MTAAESSTAMSQPDFIGSLLVADTREFVELCRVWQAAETTSDEQLEQLRERSKTLGIRARAANVGGLAHHLALGEECLTLPRADRLEECLRNILELALQLEQEIELQKAARARAVPPPAAATPAPPRPRPRPKSQPRSLPVPALPPIPAWPGWKRLAANDPARSVAPRPDGADEAKESKDAAPDAAPVIAAQPVPSEKAAPGETPAAEALAPVEAPAPAEAAAPGEAEQTASEATPSSAASLEPAEAAAPVTLAPSEIAGPASAEAPAAVADEAAPSEAQPVETTTAEAVGSTETAADAEATAHEAAATGAVEARDVAAPSHAIVLASSGPRPLLSPPGDEAIEAAAELVPGEFVAEEDEEDELTDDNLEIRLEFARRTGPQPFLLSRNEVAIDLPPPSLPAPRRRARRSRRSWVLAALGLGLLGGGALLALVLVGRLGARDADLGVATLTSSEALRPLPSAGASEPGLSVLLAQVQGLRKSDSPALSQLIDDEAGAMAKALKEPCSAGSQGCALADQARQILQQQPLPPRAQPAAEEAAVAWLPGFQPSKLAPRDDERVRNLLRFHTQNSVGREVFQGLLFQCAPFRALIEEPLAQRGMPSEILALVMVESSCELDSESLAGARGLWHLTLERARAYQLEVKPGVLDERLNPAKSTDAALELVNDLGRELRSWELAIAGYRLGPFSVLARLRQAGHDASYADLVNAGALPEEAVDYVAKVEAFALILANLQQFKFEAAPTHAQAPATLLVVPAGTRLGQVARAVGTSASKLRELNPELIADRVPGASGQQFSLQIPGDASPKARDALDRLIASGDDADECVPLNFDWSRQRFTRAMANRCKR